MNAPMSSYFLFGLSLLFGSAMIVEGCLITLFKKQITPVPMRVLAGLGIAKTHNRTKLDSLRSYAIWVLVLGPLLVAASFVYWFSVMAG